MTRPAGQASGRFVALDGLRGFAALLVALMHGEAVLGVRALDHAYLMVDLFFQMSGFVLAAGYGDRLAQGERGRWFAQVRAVRLYPLALAGLLLGLGVNAVLALRGSAAAQGQPALMFALAAVFLPWLGGGLVVPLNGPVWSLQIEFWTNAIYGFVARWLTDRRLAVIVGLSALALAFVARANGMVDGGFANNDPTRNAGPWGFLVGWARIGLSFPLGILLHRLWRRRERPLPISPISALIFVPLVLIGVSLCPPLPWPALDLAIVCLVFPGLLLLAAGANLSGAVGRVSGVLGRMSYGLYTIHAPILLLALALTPHSAPLGIRIAVFASAMTLCIVTALAAERWLDAPARRWAAARMAGGPASAPAMAASDAGA